jgi:hypothetical protein
VPEPPDDPADQVSDQRPRGSSLGRRNPRQRMIKTDPATIPAMITDAGGCGLIDLPVR